MLFFMSIERGFLGELVLTIRTFVGFVLKVNCDVSFEAFPIHAVLFAVRTETGIRMEG